MGGKIPKTLKIQTLYSPQKTKSLLETNPARNPLKKSQKSKHSKTKLWTKCKPIKSHIFSLISMRKRFSETRHIRAVVEAGGAKDRFESGARAGAGTGFG